MLPSNARRGALLAALVGIAAAVPLLWRLGSGVDDDTGFADAVLAYLPDHGGGSTPPTNTDPADALGQPDEDPVLGTGYVLLGVGGRLELRFADNRVVNSGDVAVDLAVCGSSAAVGLVEAALRPADSATASALSALGTDADGDGFYELGTIDSLAGTVELDALFPGFAPGALVFDAVQLTDAVPGASPPPFGAAIDAVGAAASVVAPLDVFSREVSVRVGPTDPPQADVISREVSVNVLSANLAVAIDAAPAAGLVGEEFEVRWTTTNLGEGTAHEAWVDRVYLSTDAALDPGDVALAAVTGGVDLTFPGGLPPGGQAPLVQRFEFPAVTGDHWLIVSVDDDNVVFEDVIEDDNVAVAGPVSIFPKLLPDLVVDSIAPPPDVDSGTALPVTFTVRNLGPGSTDVPAWKDAVFLTPDAALDASLGGEDLVALETSPVGLLPAGSTGDAYTRVVQAQLPHDIAGVYYLAVYADGAQFGTKGAPFAVAETDEANNFAFAGPFTIALEPQPNLVVPSVNASLAVQGFAGKLHPLEWIVENAGATATETGLWYEQVWLSSGTDASIEPGDVLLQSFTRLGAPLPASTQELRGPFDVLLPPVLAAGSGEHRLKVFTDWSDRVSEAAPGWEDDNVGVSGALPILQTLLPDLAPASFVGSSGTALAGHQVQVSWSVANQGGDGGDYTLSWKDAVHLSQDELLDAGDVLLKRFLQTAPPVPPGPTWAGADYAKTQVVTIPPGTPVGSWRLLLSVDDLDGVAEPAAGEGVANVLASAAFLVDDLPPDLVPTITGTPPASAAAGQVVALSWSVANDGTGGTPGVSWSDAVLLSADGVPDEADPVVAVRAHIGALQATEFYPVSALGVIPEVGPGPYQLLYVTDSQDQVTEGTGEANNAVAVPITITPDAADLVVMQVGAPKSAQAGATIPVTWSVENSGSAATIQTQWSDAVWLSANTVLDGTDQFLGSVTRSGGLQPAQGYSASGSLVLPFSSAGLWYVLVEADEGEQVFESNDDNNVGSHQMLIDVESAQLADLIVEGVSAPGAVVSGQQMSVSWTVRNVGTGPTSVDDWVDRVYLSLDEFLDPVTDLPLGYHVHTGFLGAEETVLVLAPLVVPLGASGDYFVIVETNGAGEVVEQGSAPNTGHTAFLTSVTLPPPADLVPESVTPAASAVPGEELLVFWDVRNQGATPVVGAWSDALYLSADGVLDAGDAPLGTVPVVPASGMLDAGTVETFSATVPVPGVLSGAYRVLVRSDALNQIPEVSGAGEANNIAASVASVSVDVPELALGAPFPTTLYEDETRYWKLTPPAGIAVRVELAHASPTAWAELLIGEGAMPVPGQAQFHGEDPTQPLQSVLVPETTGATYYLRSRALFGVAGIPDATLTATVEPFGIDSLSPLVAGRGVVTFVLSGSLLDTTQTVELRALDDSALLPAQELRVLTGEHAGGLLARFDISGAAPGSYALRATSALMEVVEYATPVTVEQAAPLAVEVQVIPPASIRKGSAGSALLSVRNAGNVNLPGGVLVLATSSEPAFDGLGEQELQLALADPPGSASVDAEKLSLVLLVEDLGPSQEAATLLGIELLGEFGADQLTFGLTGRVLAEGELLSDVVLVVAESLRSLVLSDPDSGAELLALAADPVAWSAPVIATYGTDLDEMFEPGTPPVLGADFVAAVAQLAAASLGPGNEVSAAIVDEVAALLSCSLFAALPFSCASLLPAACNPGLATVPVVVAAGGNVPVGAVCLQTPNSDDPNDKTKKKGFGVQSQVSAHLPLEYEIHFENVAEAAAPAAAVYIEDLLDATLEPKSVQLGEIRFGDHVIQPPEGSLFHVDTLDLSGDELGVLVQVAAGLVQGAAGPTVVWTLQAIDPATGEPPVGADLGILPPNDAEGRGEGSVRFQAVPKSGSLTGTRVKNATRVRFDSEAPITTNEVDNLLDATLPLSELDATLGGATDSAGAIVPLSLTWQGDDPGLEESGLASYSVYLSVDGGPYSPLLTDTLESSLDYDAVFGHIYAFYSLARDNTGNEEEAPLVPDAFVDLGPDCNGNEVPDDQDIALGTSTDCDGNGVPDECDPDLDGNGVADGCDPLAVDLVEISVATGGTQTFTLNAGPGHALDLYVLLGSATGTAPGIPCDGVVLPLVFDVYMNYLLLGTSPKVIASIAGLLDPDGQATNQFVLPLGAPPSTAGLNLHHAYVVLEAGCTFTSNPVPLAIVP